MENQTPKKIKQSSNVVPANIYRISVSKVVSLTAIYLDLHGAAVGEHADDIEGELLERIRSLAGLERPVVVSLDLHANVTQRMLALADALVAYRT